MRRMCPIASTLTMTNKINLLLSLASAATFNVLANDAATPPPVPRFSTNFMDRSMDPATDFYQFANGEWLKDNPIPSDKSRWGGFSELAERNWFAIHQILDDAAQSKSPARTPRRQVGDFYRSAMDTNRIEKLGLKPIQPEMKRIDRVKNTKELFALLGDLH